jgi:hypothetical protein
MAGTSIQSKLHDDLNTSRVAYSMSRSCQCHYEFAATWLHLRPAPDGVIHVVAEHLIDQSDLLRRVGGSDEAFVISAGRGDEAVHGGGATVDRWSRDALFDQKIIERAQRGVRDVAMLQAMTPSAFK